MYIRYPEKTSFTQKKHYRSVLGSVFYKRRNSINREKLRWIVFFVREKLQINASSKMKQDEEKVYDRFSYAERGRDLWKFAVVIFMQKLQNRIRIDVVIIRHIWLRIQIYEDTNKPCQSIHDSDEGRFSFRVHLGRFRAWTCTLPWTCNPALTGCLMVRSPDLQSSINKV